MAEGCQLSKVLQTNNIKLLFLEPVQIVGILEHIMHLIILMCVGEQGVRGLVARFVTSSVVLVRICFSSLAH